MRRRGRRRTLPRTPGPSLPVGTGVVVGLLTVIAALRHPPRLLPESMELVGVGSCLLGWSSPLTCSDYELLFWSPGYPLLTAPLSLLVDPLLAGGLVSVLAFAVALLGLVATLAPRLGSAPALAAAVAVGSAPSLSAYAMAVDARSTALGLTFGSLAVALAAGGHPWRRGGIAGLLAGAAALTRPELIVLLPGIVAFSAAAPDAAVPLLGRPRWSRALGAIGGIAVLWTPWVAALSAFEGRLSVLPRGVQQVGFALTGWVPERWARQAIGESAARLPLRDAVRAGSWPVDLPSGPGLDPAAGVSWLGAQLPTTCSPIVLGLAALGAGLLVLYGHLRPLLALLLVALPSLLATIALPGRDDMMPLSALLPVVWVLHAAAGIAVAKGIVAVFGPARRTAPTPWLSATVALALGLLSPHTDWPVSPDNAPSGAAAAAALARRLPQDTPVAAPFASSLQVHRAGMRWVPWPAPWESTRWTAPGAPRWALIGAVDDHLGPFDLSLPDTLALVPREAHGAGPTAVVLFEVVEAPLSPD